MKFRRTANWLRSIADWLDPPSRRSRVSWLYSDGRERLYVDGFEYEQVRRDAPADLDEAFQAPERAHLTSECGPVPLTPVVAQRRRSKDGRFMREKGRSRK